MRRKILASVLIAAAPLTMASTCSAHSDGKTPRTVHTYNTTPPVPVKSGKVVARSYHNGTYTLTLKTDTINRLEFQVSGKTYAKCTVGKSYPKCDK